MFSWVNMISRINLTFEISWFVNLYSRENRMKIEQASLCNNLSCAMYIITKVCLISFPLHHLNSRLLKYHAMEVTSISWSDSLEKMAWVQFEWRVTDHSKFIAQVSRATEAAATTSVFLCAAAAADGGAADWEKWIALSHESISVALHKVSLQPSCCLTSPKQTREWGLQSASHHSHHFPLSLSRPNSLSLCYHSSSFSVKPYSPACVCICVSPLSELLSAVSKKLHKSPFAVS